MESSAEGAASNDDAEKADSSPAPPPAFTTKADQMSNVRSTTSTIAPKERSCCYRFWNSIFKFFAHDSIHGSLVGPHPVSFMFCCCNCCCKRTCVAPFALASVATKLMWILMLIFVSCLSCFFIIPFGKVFEQTTISDFYPCHEWNQSRAVNDNLTKNCDVHGGYFMVYRNFFAFDLLLLISCFNMINVKSTIKNRKRAKMHHGFWLYKYIILFILLLISYLAIRVEMGGIFEYVWHWVGLLAVLVFSFVEVTFLLDIVELFCEQNRTSSNDWADCVYWGFCFIISFLDCAIIVLLCSFYSTNEYLDEHKNQSPEHGRVVPSHVGILSFAVFLTLCLLISGIINMKRKLFKYTGMLQTCFVILYMLITIWSALGSSLEVTARPHFDVPGIESYNRSENKGNLDTNFKPESCIHGLLSFFALLYYVFWHGPRTTTAPMSILFDKIFFSMSKKSELPVIPVFDKKIAEESIDNAKPNEDVTSSGNANDVDPPTATPAGIEGTTHSSSSISPESPTTTPADIGATTAEKETQKNDDPAEDYANAIKEFKVWDDEKEGVRYSWSMFYFFMIIGSMNIMMQITSLSDPWATQWYSSSYPAMGIQLGAACMVTTIYIVTTTFPCRKIFAEVIQNPVPDQNDPENEVTQPQQETV